MRVLFSCSPAFGHFHPLVPLAQAFVAAGHELAFAISGDMAGKVEAAGLKAFSAGIPLQARKEAMRGLMAEMMQAPPAERPKLGFPRVFGKTYAPVMLPMLRSAADFFKPDLMVHDTSELCAPIVGTERGIPFVEHSFGHLLPNELIELAMPFVEPLWKGVAGGMPPLAGLRKHCYLDICPPSLQLPAIAEVTTRKALRPVPYDGGEGEAPPWIKELEKPIVYVTLGTVFNESAPLFKKILDALKEEPISLVVTVGPAGEPEALGEVGPRVRVERYVPQTAIFGKVAAVVSHGGSGTMLSALSAGLPLLMIPQGADQFRNGELLAATGAGKALMPDQVNKESIRGAVRALLDDAEHRKAARKLRAEIDGMPAPADVVRQLVALRA